MPEICSWWPSITYLYKLRQHCPKRWLSTRGQDIQMIVCQLWQLFYCFAFPHDGFSSCRSSKTDCSLAMWGSRLEFTHIHRRKAKLGRISSITYIVQWVWITNVVVSSPLPWLHFKATQNTMHHNGLKISTAWLTHIKIGRLYDDPWRLLKRNKMDAPVGTMPPRPPVLMDCDSCNCMVGLKCTNLMLFYWSDPMWFLEAFVFSHAMMSDWWSASVALDGGVNKFDVFLLISLSIFLSLHIIGVNKWWIQDLIARFRT